MRLIFSKIHRESIFCNDFENLGADNGTIEFKRKGTSGGIAVVYAPNGTGKSSFAEVLKSNVSSEQIDFQAVNETGKTIVPQDAAFHIISDQISRHIIGGDESQYLIGRDIRREYTLIKQISLGFEEAFKDLSKKYKDNYCVSKVTDTLLDYVKPIDEEGYRYIRDIVNVRSKGKGIDREQIALAPKERTTEKCGIIEPTQKEATQWDERASSAARRRSRR